MRYSAFDRELLACCAGNQHFRYMLKGRLFTIYTVHKPLTYASGKLADGWTTKQFGQLSYKAEFTTGICHVLYVDNVAADTLSRPPSHTVGLDSFVHTARLDSCYHIVGPDSSSHITGLDSYSYTVRADSSQPQSAWHFTWLLCLLVWSCWTMLSLPRIN
jgi:hypothetical protein